MKESFAGPPGFSVYGGGSECGRDSQKKRVSECGQFSNIQVSAFSRRLYE